MTTVGFRRWVSVLLGTSALLIAGCGRSSDEADPAEYLSGIVSIGVNTDLPGWSAYTNGIWDGFDIALGNWLGREIGFTPQYVSLKTDERMTRLTERSDIKLVIANFSITDERRKSIDFVGPYLTDSQGVMTLVGSPINARKDIENKTICVTHGSTNQQRLFDMKIEPSPENTLQRCVDRLRNHEGVDAISSDRVILDGFVAHDQKHDLRVVPNIRVGSERYGIGIRNNSPKLCEFLREKLAKFIDEEWDHIFRDKLPNASPEDRKPNSLDLNPCENPA
ncbi:transporter substrate-binding domain-containing protein [Phytohabitans maris]|nr:transporter substrate-binding domain-containing protein [Phytohabitans sp. ZYX-F-186]